MKCSTPPYILKLTSWHIILKLNNLDSHTVQTLRECVNSYSGEMSVIRHSMVN